MHQFKTCLIWILLPLLLTACNAIPAILFGNAGKDALKSAVDVFEAIEDDDPAQKKKDWHAAADDIAESGIEAGEAEIGMDAKINLDFWNDQEEK